MMRVTVMVAFDRAHELRANGFSAESCGGKEAGVAEDRNQICAMASGMPQSGQ